VASIATIEQSQERSPERARSNRAVRAVYEALRERATTRTTPKPGCKVRARPGSAEWAGYGETAGRPTVS
jgi:hypothetical protein